MVASRSCVAVSVFPSVYVVRGAYCKYYSYSTLNLFSRYSYKLYRVLFSPSRSDLLAEDPSCLLMVCCILSTCYCKRLTVLPCVVCQISSAAYFVCNPVSRVRWWAFSAYSVVICFSTSLYFWLVFWYSSIILVNYVFKLPLKSSIDFVLAVCVCSIPFIRSEDS